MACKTAFKRADPVLSIVILTVIVLASCARAKSLSSEELRSDLVSAVSLASESDIFVGQIEGRHLTREFQSGHASSLRDEAERQAKDLRKSTPQSSQLQAVHVCIDQLDQLAYQLELIKEITGNERELPAIRQRVQAIVQSLNAAKAGL